MTAVTTKAIVLKRVNFGEADRIITLLTPDHGKVSVIAKGVRKSKSKLAGGVELFNISDISFIQGKGDISTLISARLDIHFSSIIKSIQSLDVAYQIIKTIDRATEDAAEAAYFDILRKTLKAIDEAVVPAAIVKQWFGLQLLKLNGHEPDFARDLQGNKLSPERTYEFYVDEMKFSAPPNRVGSYNPNHIKFLRLCLQTPDPSKLAVIENLNKTANITEPLVQTMLASNIRL